MNFGHDHPVTTLNIGSHHPFKNRLVTVIVIGLLLFVAGVTFCDFPDQSEVPLLLGSGLTSAGQAEMRLIVLAQEDTFVPEIRDRIPDGWNWQERVVKGNGEQHRLFLGKVAVDSPQIERAVFQIYRKLATALRPYGAKVFLHEFIEESIDPAAYLSRIGAHPSQWVNSYDTLSIAAFEKEIPGAVLAGSDRINIQVLSRESRASARTVLAIPVLLGGF